ncbi:MAG: hypothetical protein PHF79_03905 [Candidatus Pacebacteria bacterium]|nr:hypothetical protein [Candidatus Paceibacterota bacterium]
MNIINVASKASLVVYLLPWVVVTIVWVVFSFVAVHQWNNFSLAGSRLSGLLPRLYFILSLLLLGLSGLLIVIAYIY